MNQHLVAAPQEKTGERKANERSNPKIEATWPQGHCPLTSSLHSAVTPTTNHGHILLSDQFQFRDQDQVHPTALPKCRTRQSHPRIQTPRHWPVQKRGREFTEQR